MHRKLFVLFAIVLALGLLVPNALASWSAGGTPSGSDDWANDTPPTIPGSDNPALGDHCDTLDPIGTVDRNNVSYRCIDLSALGGTAERGYANLTGASLSAVYDPAIAYNDAWAGTGGTALNPAHNFLKLTFNSQARIPQQGDVLPEDANGAPAPAPGGYSFQFYFQSPNRQNHRQIVGQTIGCQRYAHMGPYLTGNSEFIDISYNLTVEETGTTADIRLGHLDYASAGDFQFLADPAMTGVKKCDGSTPDLNGQSFPGTRARTEYSADQKTVNVYIPMIFAFVDNQGNPIRYTIARPGDPIINIHARVSALVDTATTPEAFALCDDGAQGVNENLPSYSQTRTNCKVAQNSSGIQNTVLLDWMPWSAQDLGLTVPNQIGPQVWSPRCPNFGYLEYRPGGGKDGTGGTYAPLGKGSNGEDLDYQVNPLYASDQDLVSTSHYDAASGGDGPTAMSQDHSGPTGCTIPVQDAATIKPTGNSLTA